VLSAWGTSHQIVERKRFTAQTTVPHLTGFIFELSRGFKALKLWMFLKEQGVAKFGRLIDQNIVQRAYLTELITADPRLEPVAPTTINIVCFRYSGNGGSEASLRAGKRHALVHGRHCLRVAINNHRTRLEDLQLLSDEILKGLPHNGNDTVPAL
jgi:aromatic-L-amino-acid decarboxylase